MKNGNKIAVFISCFGWYEERLIYIEKYLQAKGYQVFIILSDFNHHLHQIDKKYSHQDNVKYCHVLPYKKNISVKRMLSHWLFAKKARTVAESLNPSLVYCLVPPNSLVRELGRLTKKKPVRLIFDVIDMWPESFPKGNKNFPPFVVWRNMRDKYINLADDVVLECNYYKNIMQNKLDRDNLHVFHLIKPHLIKKKFNSIDKDHIYLAYLGSINSLIDIDCIIKVIGILKKLKPVVLRIIGDGELKENFISRAKECGAEVEYFGKIYDDEKKYELLGPCHFGLNIYKTNTNIGLTCKSIDYFQMGLPIINTISGDTENLVEKYGIGLNLKDLSQWDLKTYIDEIEQNRQKVNEIFDKFFDEKNIAQMLSFLK